MQRWNSGDDDSLPALSSNMQDRSNLPLDRMPPAEETLRTSNFPLCRRMTRHIRDRFLFEPHPGDNGNSPHCKTRLSGLTIRTISDESNEQEVPCLQPLSARAAQNKHSRPRHKHVRPGLPEVRSSPATIPKSKPARALAEDENRMVKKSKSRAPTLKHHS